MVQIWAMSKRSRIRAVTLHRALAGFLGVESHAMRMAAGEELTERETHLAGIEEEAVLHCQRWLHHAGGTAP